MDAQTSLVGNLTRDVELRYTPAGRAAASFGMACSYRYQSNGEWQERTSFFNVECWGDLAENVAESIGKGQRVLVHGRLEQQTWEKEGEKRSTVVCVADSVGPDLRWATAKVTKVTREAAGATPITAGRKSA